MKSRPLAVNRSGKLAVGGGRSGRSTLLQGHHSIQISEMDGGVVTGEAGGRDRKDATLVLAQPSNDTRVVERSRDSYIGNDCGKFA